MILSLPGTTAGRVPKLHVHMNVGDCFGAAPTRKAPFELHCSLTVDDNVEFFF